MCVRTTKVFFCASAQLRAIDMARSLASAAALFRDTFVLRHCYTWWVLWCACIFPVNTGQFIRIVHLCDVYFPLSPREGSACLPQVCHCRQAAPNKPSSLDVEHDSLATNYDIPFSYRVTSSQDDLWVSYSHFRYYRQWLLTASTFRLSQQLSALRHIVIRRSGKTRLTDSIRWYFNL